MIAKINNDPITAKELASLIGEPNSTIDYWTKIGLLSVVKRRRGIRYYDKKDSLARYETINRERDKGVPLQTIKEKFDNISK